ncbi:hypothetical protein [Polymorphospora lycopeni]|uniref:Uncharacterized protein n=1 Tax=Polymorphospora lycopeni TaxID=3140240 RepID=A0ABV5CYV0_9ACTN
MMIDVDDMVQTRGPDDFWQAAQPLIPPLRSGRRARRRSHRPQWHGLLGYGGDSCGVDLDGEQGLDLFRFLLQAYELGLDGPPARQVAVAFTELAEAI